MHFKRNLNLAGTQERGNDGENWWRSEGEEGSHCQNPRPRYRSTHRHTHIHVNYLGERKRVWKGYLRARERERE